MRSKWLYFPKDSSGRELEEVGSGKGGEGKGQQLFLEGMLICVVLQYR
jgi:hypothetical protein